MIASKFIYLVPNFDDEGEWDDHDWIEYPGRIVAGVLSEILQGLGYKVEAVDSEGPKGWEFSFWDQGVQLWMRVGAIEDFLIVLGAPGWLDIFGRKKKVFTRMIERLAAALAADARFGNIRWYTKQQMDAGEWEEGSMSGRDEPPA
ncbi:hypothetical protein [Phenylobacterium sp.]|uniref:hypothetical protein n=1 Tax=Phenylobacterium sp. TaxID=1871053 RepID=UPI002DEB8EF0|nr:hypothetical protein [Phenylobacterium sp.]